METRNQVSTGNNSGQETRELVSATTNYELTVSVCRESSFMGGGLLIRVFAAGLMRKLGTGDEVSK